MLRQRPGRLVPPVAVLLQRLHHDPVQLAAHQLGQLGRLHVPIGRDRRQRLARRYPAIDEARRSVTALLLFDSSQLRSLTREYYSTDFGGELELQFSTPQLPVWLRDLRLYVQRQLDIRWRRSGDVSIDG